MTESWGESLYRAAVYIAVVVALLAMVNFIANFSESEPIVPLPAVALAVIVWLTGVGCRAVLGARKAERLRHNMKQVIL